MQWSADTPRSGLARTLAKPPAGGLLRCLRLPGTATNHAAPVLLLHSGGMSSRQWRRLAEALAPAHEVFAPDFLGSGDNPPWAADTGFDLGMELAPLERRIAELDQPVHLVGHSYGGLIALTLARRQPARVRSLAVYDPVAFGVLHAVDDREGLVDLARAEGDPAFTDPQHGGDAAWLEAFIDYWNGPGSWRGLALPAQQSFLRAGRKVFAEVMSLMRDRTPAAAYAAITAPTLLLSGGRSPTAARRVVALLAQALPRAQLLEFADAGHMGPLTHAERVNAAIVTHITGAVA
jgi:pimeloyl-ACP methyl ester carboxylesterase